MYGKVLSAAVLSAAVILPNTGSSRTVSIVSIVVVTVGAVAIATTVGSAIAKRVFKA
ncbi:MAG: hypothetical protein WCO19_02320 [Candidatus Saccharibacteria bacterium]